MKVDLDGIIGDELEAADVTINFESLDIDNKGIFYTDSNSMKM